MIRGVLCRNCNSMEGKITNCIRRAKRELTPEQWFHNLVIYWKAYILNPSGVIHPTHKSAEQKRVLRNKRAKRRRKRHG